MVPTCTQKQQTRKKMQKRTQVLPLLKLGDGAIGTQKQQKKKKKEKKKGSTSSPYVDTS
jgi:hypothetical protein